MAETAIQFLERWRQAHVYAELRALEQLDETVAECIGAAAEDGISADELEKASGGSLKESWPRKFGRSGRWSFCLMTGTLCPSNQERS